MSEIKFLYDMNNLETDVFRGKENDYMELQGALFRFRFSGDVFKFLSREGLYTVLTASDLRTIADKLDK